MSSSTFVAICFDAQGLPFVHIRQLLPTAATDGSAAGIAINTDGLFLYSNAFSNLLIQLKGLEMMLLDITAKNHVQYSSTDNLKSAANESDKNDGSWQAKTSYAHCNSIVHTCNRRCRRIAINMHQRHQQQQQRARFKQKKMHLYDA